MAIEAVIIGNPNSGSAGDEGYLERFAEILRAGGLQIEVLNTERAEKAKAAIRDCQVAVVDDCEHAIVIEKPQVLIKEVGRFLREKGL